MIFRFGILFFQDPQLGGNFRPHFRDHGIIKTCGINRSRSVELVLKKSHGKISSELGEKSISTNPGRNPPPFSKNRFLRRGVSMRGIQISGNLRIWTIFREPAARKKKKLFLPLETIILHSKTAKIFACLRRAKNTHTFYPYKSWFCVPKTPKFSRLRREK